MHSGFMLIKTRLLIERRIEMKRKIIFGMLTWFLFLSIVLAVPMPPQPIGGKLDAPYVSVEDIRVMLTNLNTGETKNIYSNNNGEWLVDWANTQYGYAGGHEVEVVVWFCKEEAICTKTVTIEGEPIFVYFDLSSVLVPVECPPCPDPTEEECRDLYPCPVTTTITTTICPECEELNAENCLPFCEECLCPDATFNYVATAIISLFLGMGAYRYGFGIKTYTKRTGEVVTQHKHHGIIAYHDPSVLHKNPRIRHPRGEVSPKYKKASDGKWEYVGE